MLPRGLAAVALVAALGGCHAPEPRALTNEELTAAGEALAASLKGVETKPKATVVIVGDRSDLLVEAGDRRAVESGRFVEVIHDRERRPDFVIVPEREGEGGGTWELIELATKRRLFKSSWQPPRK